uniref:Uncharacterized protein n=1 Tax=Rhizophora mucronata TaxID=61149 RepID=A0A2P2LX19_RHIMU
MSLDLYKQSSMRSTRLEIKQFSSKRKKVECLQQRKKNCRRCPSYVTYTNPLILLAGFEAVILTSKPTKKECT